MADFILKFTLNFIAEDRWKFLSSGLTNTLIVTVASLVLGLIIGFFIAFIRVTHDTTGRLRLPNWLANLYLTIIRGTPVTIQIMIIYYVIFASVNLDKLPVAIISFGINSAAYVAEIFRGGIMSIDSGQMEAGRSLGLNYWQSMGKIVMPQAIKNVLPALGNEGIALLKETSVAGFIALRDLTQGANIIRSVTYDAFMPLIAAALIYLIVVLILQALVGQLERRLAKSDRR